MEVRMLKALANLKQSQIEEEKRLKVLEDFNEQELKVLEKLLKEYKEYTIKDNYWYINGENTGVRAIGIDGKDGIDGRDGRDGRDGAPGKDGIDGKDGIGTPGRDGVDGKDGKDGKDGRDGVDGKDGETPELAIGKVEASEEPGDAKAKLRKKDDKYYLDLTLPMGRQGFPGFDGKDATINGQKTLNIVAGDNIIIEQEDEELKISSLGGGGGSGGPTYKAGDNIDITNNVISVLTTDDVEEDNTKPITSAAVYTEVGNINILLETI